MKHFIILIENIVEKLQECNEEEFDKNVVEYKKMFHVKSI